MTTANFAAEAEAFPKLHPVQWQILGRLSLASGLRFNEIKPKLMDPKRFTYHLTQLQEFGLIRHDPNSQTYQLTDRGKTVIDYFHQIPNWSNLPLNSFILLYIQRSGKVLVVQRNRQPFLNYVGLPSLNTEQGKFVGQTAQEALESFGLKGKPDLKLIIEGLFQSDKEKVIRHAFMLTFFCSNPTGDGKGQCEEGKLFWQTPEELLKAKPGYDNSEDLVRFFNQKSLPAGISIISKIYRTPW